MQRKRDAETAAAGAADVDGAPAKRVAEAPRNPYADSSVQERTVFVSNLHFKVTPERLRAFLAKVRKRGSERERERERERGTGA